MPCATFLLRYIWHELSMEKIVQHGGETTTKIYMVTDVEAICYIKVISNCPYGHEEAASQRREPVTLFWYTSDMK